MFDKGQKQSSTLSCDSSYLILGLLQGGYRIYGEKYGSDCGSGSGDLFLPGKTLK